MSTLRSASGPSPSVEIEVLGYTVRIGAGLLDQVGQISHALAPASTYAVITDDQVGPRWLPAALRSLSLGASGARVVTHAIPAGEAHKTREMWSALTDWMLDAGCGRDSTVIALGGGVVGDLAGFVAATYMRGVPVVQVPTSLLAMVDASIGGKTGVDTPAGKNLVGAFHRPSAVVVDPAMLATLPPAHVRAGLAEVLKHGAIADADYFHAASAFARRAHATLSRDEAVRWSDGESVEIIARSVAIKADVVRRDEREAGHRQILNAGHTIAHAVEVVSGYGLLHGEAVAMGLVTEAQMAEATGVAANGTARTLADTLGGAGLPTSLPPGLDPDRMVAAMRLDKKARGGRVAFALLADIGRAAGSEATGWSTMLDEDLVRRELGRGRATPNGPGLTTAPGA